MAGALLTDLYELNMAASYLRRQMTAAATFSLFVRKLPPERGFLVAAGIEDCLDLLTAGFEALHLAGQMTGTQVLGGCLAANAARNLERESGIESYSLAMLVSRLTTGQIRLRPGAIIVVDECSQASSQQLHALWQHVKRVGGRLIGSGDERQLQSVEAGGLFRAIQTQVPDVVVRLDETRRQHDPEERVSSPSSTTGASSRRPPSKPSEGAASATSSSRRWSTAATASSSSGIGSAGGSMSMNRSARPPQPWRRSIGTRSKARAPRPSCWPGPTTSAGS